MTEKTAMTSPTGWMDTTDMVHPALQILDWDDDRTDVHGIAAKTTMGAAVSTIGVVATELSCYCGFKTGPRPTDREAFEALVEHALTTCAD